MYRYRILPSTYQSNLIWSDTDRHEGQAVEALDKLLLQLDSTKALFTSLVLTSALLLRPGKWREKSEQSMSRKGKHRECELIIAVIGLFSFSFFF